MKILLVGSSLRPESGWGTYGLNTATELKARGHDVRVLVHEGNPEARVDHLAILPPPLSPLGSPLSRWKTTWIVWNEIRRFQPDVVHFLIEPYAFCLPLLRRLGVRAPIVMNCHGTYGVLPLHRPSTQKTMCATYAQLTRILVCSEYTKGRVLDAVASQCGTERRAQVEAKMQLFRLGIAAPERTRQKTGDAPKRVLFVGGVKPRKGVQELLRACATFRAECAVPLRVEIIGDADPANPYVNSTRALINELGLSSVVTLRGHVSDAELKEEYDKADLLTLLSRNDGHHFEGFGLVFLEANARGIPVIGSDDSGCREAIDEGKSGYAVPADDPAAIADRMKRILADGAIDPDACVRWARQHSVARQVDAIETAYAQARA